MINPNALSLHRLDRPKRVIVALVFLIPVALGLSVSIGSVDVDWSDLARAWHAGETTLASTVVFELRLPRALSALLIGASLALAGVLMQVLLRNPLADPYVLGTSGGAAVFALAVMVVGLSNHWVPLAATVGAGVSMGLLMMLARSPSDWGSSRLLLTGIVLASGWGALISFTLSIGEARQLQGMLFWLMGDLAAEPPGPIRVVIFTAVLIVALIASRDLDLLAGGELRARSLGLNTSGLRVAILIGASLLTAAAVTLSGPIGFIGLVVPHMMRLMVGADHRHLIPASVLAGGALLVLAEMIARTLIAPQQLPVGVITAFIGVPVFLYLLKRGATGREE